MNKEIKQDILIILSELKEQLKQVDVDINYANVLYDTLTDICLENKIMTYSEIAENKIASFMRQISTLNIDYSNKINRDNKIKIKANAYARCRKLEKVIKELKDEYIDMSNIMYNLKSDIKKLTLFYGKHN